MPQTITFEWVSQLPELRPKNSALVSTKVLSNHFLRWPTVADLKRLYAANKARGFPGLIGSLDCTHWVWRACRRARAGAHQGKEGKPTIVIEALAGHDLRIWHLFAGTPGSCNDINVLDRSPLLNHFMNSVDPVNQVQFSLNNKKKTTGYMLADGIYPEYAVIAKPIRETSSAKEVVYNMRLSSVRKDVERAFGVLKGRYGILDRPSRYHRVDDLILMYRACVTLHNLQIDYQVDPLCLSSMVIHTARIGVLNPMIEIVANTHHVTARQSHHNLRQDLVDHIWNKTRQSSWVLD